MSSRLLKILPVALLLSGCLHAQSVETALQVGGDVKAPMLIKHADPVYPHPRFFGGRHTGEVVIGLIVDAQGVPKDLRLLKPRAKDLDKSALDCVSQYRFRPALKNGVPVSVEIEVAVNFQIF